MKILIFTNSKLEEFECSLLKSEYGCIIDIPGGTFIVAEAYGLLNIQSQFYGWSSPLRGRIAGYKDHGFVVSSVTNEEISMTTRTDTKLPIGAQIVTEMGFTYFVNQHGVISDGKTDLTLESLMKQDNFTATANTSDLFRMLADGKNVHECFKMALDMGGSHRNRDNKNEDGFSFKDGSSAFITRNGQPFCWEGVGIMVVPMRSPD